jgi:tellurite resistance protein TerC
VQRFHLLHYGLALVLVFVGLKMVWLDAAAGGKLPIEWSLGIIGVLLAGAVAASLLIDPPVEPTDGSALGAGATPDEG